MVDVASIIINGFAVSAIYALIAIGFTLIMSIRGVINLAHGGFIMVGAYSYFILTRHLPDIAALLVAIAVTGVISYLIYRAIISKIEHDVVITLAVTIVIAFILQEIAVIQFSQAPRVLQPLVSGGAEIANTRIRYNSILAFGISWIVIGALWYFVNKTDTGLAILATSMSDKGAKLMGVDISSVNAITWVIAGGFAGLAGVFIGSLQGASPSMWLEPLSLAFIIVVIGGVGSIKGSIMGAYLIGIVETITVSIGSPKYRGLFSLIILLAIILVKPEGLYGREYVE